MSGFPKGGTAGLVAGAGITLTPPSTVGVTPGTYSAVFSPESYAAVGDGVADDTTAVQAAVNAAVAAGAPARRTVYLAADYLTGKITCTGTGIVFTGPGRLIQKAAGANHLDLSRSTDCRVKALRFVGVGGTTVAGANCAVYADTASGLIVSGNKMSGYLEDAVQLANCTDSYVGRNDCPGNSQGMLFVQCSRLAVTLNVLRDPQVPAATFTHGISFDSKGSLSAYTAPKTDLDCSGNIVANYVNAQGVLAHRLTHSAITDNIFDNCLDGIGLINTSTADAISGITVTGNVYIGTSTAGAGAISNYGIQVGGGIRTDAGAGTTNLSPTVTDAAIVAADLGHPVTGAGIPANSYVGTVTPGVSFLLSSSPTSQVNVNATATATVSIVITYATDHVTIVGNHIANANAVVQAVGQGGIGIGYANQTVIRDNTLTGCYCNGIAVGNPCTTFDITGNTIDGVVSATAQQAGIELTSAASGSTGVVGRNVIDGGAAGLLHCVRSDMTTAGAVIREQTLLGTWTNAITSPNHAAVLVKPGTSGGQNSISSAATPVSGTTYRNNTGRFVRVEVPASATALNTAGTVTVALDSVNPAVATLPVRRVDDQSTAAQPVIVDFIVPPGCFWSVTASGATLAALAAYEL